MSLLEQNLGLVGKVAGKVHARLQAAGSSMEFDDVFQSAAEIFLKCEKHWDESKGRISTYYMRAAYNDLNKVVEKELKQSLDHFSEVGRDDETLQAHELEEAVAAVEKVSSCYSHLHNPEMIASRQDAIERLSESLSPVAQFILTNLICPDETISSLVNEELAKARWGNELGMATYPQYQASLHLICQALITGGVPRAIVKSARKELRNAAID